MKKVRKEIPLNKGTCSGRGAAFGIEESEGVGR